MTLAEIIKMELYDENYTAGVFVDLKKAFHIVDHNIITMVLEVSLKIGFVLAETSEISMSHSMNLIHLANQF